MLIEVELREVCRSTEMNVILLGEKNSGSIRVLPIYIGEHEAQMLEMSLHKIDPARPLTHDLALHIIKAMGGQLRRVIIDRLEQSTFYAKLDVQIERAGSEKASAIWIDSRPSDALVIATKSGVGIFAEESVLEEAGIDSGDDEEDMEDF